MFIKREIGLHTFCQQVAPLIRQWRLLDPSQGLGPQPGCVLFGDLHQCGQGNAQPVVSLEILYRIKARQTHVQELEAKRSQLPEVLLVYVDSNTVETNMKKKCNRQHRQLVLVAE